MSQVRHTERQSPSKPDIPISHHSGTCDIYETNEQSPIGLKCDTSGSTPIILVPQPSNDPNDPLVCFDNNRDSSAKLKII